MNMETTLYNQSGEKTGTMLLPERMFNVPFNSDVVHQVLVAQTANARLTLAHTKGRGEVRGGGKKPWRQKGTGRARHGSIRSPIWKGGGVNFGPKKERNFSQSVNKKQKALAMVLSAKVKQRKFALLDSLVLESAKTKIMSAMTRGLLSSVFSAPPHKKILLVIPKAERNIVLAARNLSRIKVISADSLNVHDLLSHVYVFMPKDALAVIERVYVKTKTQKSKIKNQND